MTTIRGLKEKCPVCGNDIVEKVKYYLEHETERMEKAQSAYGLVKNKYSFDRIDISDPISPEPPVTKTILSFRENLSK